MGLPDTDKTRELEKRADQLEAKVARLEMMAELTCEITNKNSFTIEAVLTWIRSQPRSGRTDKAQCEAILLNNLERTLDQISREAAPQADESSVAKSFRKAGLEWVDVGMTSEPQDPDTYTPDSGNTQEKL